VALEGLVAVVSELTVEAAVVDALCHRGVTSHEPLGAYTTPHDGGWAPIPSLLWRLQVIDNV
jgi:hypothetical protein